MPRHDRRQRRLTAESTGTGVEGASVPGLRSVILTATAAALLVAGCGDDGTGGEPAPTPSSNGIADKAPEEIIRLAKEAFRQAGSVRVKGNGTNDGAVYAVDMRIKGAAGGKGTVTVEHNLVTILRIGKQAYLKGDADFWKAAGDPAVAELLKGKYLKAPSDRRQLESILLFTDAGTFADKILKVDGGARKGERRTVAGVETVGVIFKSGKDEVTMYVATTGKPYPMQILTTSTDVDAGELVFTDYDKPLELTPPPADQVVDTSKLGG
jgi:hypothetical protein